MRSELDEAFKGTCENCKKEDIYVRRIANLDRFHGGIRRYWNICFECVRPTREFMSRTRGIMNTPVKEEVYQKWLKEREQ